MRRTTCWSVICLLFVIGVAPTKAEAQEAEVRAAVAMTLEAWANGDFEAFADFYHSDVRGFFLDGSALAEGFQVDALQAVHEEGLRAEMSLRELNVDIYGATAVSAGYLDGSIVLPGGMALSGSWRYTETRVQADGVWKVVQYHFSQFAAGL